MDQATSNEQRAKSRGQGKWDRTGLNINSYQLEFAMVRVSVFWALETTESSQSEEQNIIKVLTEEHPKASPKPYSSNFPFLRVEIYSA